MPMAAQHFLKKLISRLLKPNQINVYFPKGYRNHTDFAFQGFAFTAMTLGIEGIVSEQSQGGLYRDPYKDNFVFHTFYLSAWRIHGASELHHGELRVLRPVLRDTDYFKDVPAYSAVKLRVALNEARTIAFMEAGWFLNAQQEPFREAILELSKPVTFDTALFGVLTLDKSIDWFNGKGIWNGLSVNVRFQMLKKYSIERSLHVAEQLWMEQASWDNRIKNYAVQELLALKNEDWLETDEAEVDAATFRNRMSLESISFEADGTFTFYHIDGDLFYGHYIAITGNLEEGPNYADIPG